MPLKRHMSLQDFSREHHEELLLGWKIKRGLAKGIEASRIASYCKHFYEHYLSRHMEKEERYIFSKLNPADPDAVKLRKEHRQVKQIIEGLGQDPINTLDFLKILAHELDTHIRYEERVFFERLQQELNEEVLMTMKPDEEQIKELLEWEDSFW
jgi:iron-sulfur cluster repair protein YtfE (RIC family)